MKKPRRIVLFRFHKEFEICKNCLEILRKFNSDILIYGLYGGHRKIPSKKFFNADQNEISPDEVIKAYKKGVKLFHPVRRKLILP